MKNLYIEPTVEVIRFSTQDVIKASNGTGETPENEFGTEVGDDFFD